jgi:hypothetical protein
MKEEGIKACRISGKIHQSEIYGKLTLTKTTAMLQFHFTIIY